MSQDVLELIRPKISTVRLTADDWLTLRDLRLQALDDSPGSFLGDLAAEGRYSRNRWRQEIGRHDWFIATLDAKPVGLVKLNRNQDSHDGMHLEALWVAPGARCRGVGEALISAVEKAAATLGERELKLWIFIDNPTVRDFYLRRGYTGPHRTQMIAANGRITYEKEYQKLLEPAFLEHAR